MDQLITADAARFRDATAADLAAARQALAALKALPPTASFEEVLAAHDAIGRPLNRSAGLTHLFFQVHPDGELRAAAAEIEQEVQRFSTELSLDQEVYGRLADLDLDQAPDPVSRRVVEKALDAFRRAGVDRDEATRQRVAQLQERLVELGQAFSRNIAGDVRSVAVEPDQLEGLPDDFVAAHPPGPDGRVTITTDPTDTIPVLKFARSRDLRQALHRENGQRATPDNLELLDQLVATRHELATLLGYAHWADLVTEDKMIGSAANAAEFIARIVDLTGARMDEEVAELERELRRQEGDVARLCDYDRMYLVETLRRRKLAFDSREARPYLPYERVLGGVFETLGRLFDVQVVARDDLPRWHEDVGVHELVRDGRVLARFYLDMHPRPDKFKHAAMFDLVAGTQGGDLPMAALACNLPRPTADDPALLDPSEVRTLFHEFGHLLHHLLASQGRWLATAGISTEWDFVEVPSQLFEEWARDPEVLASFARHHETGETIPAALVERMIAAEDYGKALNTRVQMFYASLSLEAHRTPPEDFDSDALVARLKGRLLPMPVEQGTHFQASFGHLEGYTALYYTYMWSLVLAKDCHGAFGGDLMNADTATRYRDTILAAGGSKDAAELLQDFLGRPYRFDAFEAWLAA